jgi:hypothetical protein
MRTKRRQSSRLFRQIGVGLTAVAALAITGCQDATGPDDILPGLSVQTGAETIHFVPSGERNSITVPITITNNSDKTLSLSYCSESLERFSPRGWATVFLPVCTLANLHTLPPIPAGTSLTFNFSAWDTPPQYPGFRFTDPQNLYRVRVGLWIVDTLGGEPVPRGSNITNPFNVEP